MAQSPAADSESSTSLETVRNTLSATTADQLTLLIFKDNSTPRTFRIPLRWITQFGWLLGAIFLTTLLSVGIAVKAVVSKPRSSFSKSYEAPDESQKVHDLESKLQEAQSRLQTLSTPAAQDPAQTNTAPIIDPKLISAASPLSAQQFLFKGLPDLTQLPAGTQVPISLGGPVARWEGKTLKVRFHLQYESSKPGGQQGRILILARGPGMILTHPAQLFQSVGKDFLIDPNNGEYFSVSRYREAKADFGPLPSHDSIKEVEVIILSSEGQLLIHENIVPGGKPAAAQEAPQEIKPAQKPEGTGQPPVIPQ